MGSEAVCDGTTFMCACGNTYKMQVISSSAKGSGKKLAAKTNCMLTPCGPCLGVNPPVPAPPTASISKEGQSPVKIDQMPALGAGCQFSCMVGPGKISVAAPGQTSVKYETSGGVSVKEIAAAVGGVVGGPTSTSTNDKNKRNREPEEEKSLKKGTKLKRDIEKRLTDSQLTEEEVVDFLDKSKHLKKYSSPDGKWLEWKDMRFHPPKTRAKVHPPHKATNPNNSTPYRHLHILNKKGEPLQPNLKPGKRTSPDVHIKIIESK